MKTTGPISMTEALRLTRRGRLAEAASLLQSLAGGHFAAPAAATARAPIDLVPEQVRLSPAASPARTPEGRFLQKSFTNAPARWTTGSTSRRARQPGCRSS